MFYDTVFQHQMPFAVGGPDTRRHVHCSVETCHRNYVRNGDGVFQGPHDNLLLANKSAQVAMKGQCFKTGYAKRGTTSGASWLSSVTAQELAHAAIFREKVMQNAFSRKPAPSMPATLRPQAVAFFKSLQQSTAVYPYSPQYAWNARIRAYSDVYHDGKATWWLSLTPEATAQVRMHFCVCVCIRMCLCVCVPPLLTHTFKHTRMFVCVCACVCVCAGLLAVLNFCLRARTACQQPGGSPQDERCMVKIYGDRRASRRLCYVFPKIHAGGYPACLRMG